MAVTALENNVKGTLELNSSRARTWQVKKSYFTALCFCVFMKSQTWVQELCPSLSCLLSPIPSTLGGQSWKSCGEVHLQRSCLCAASVFAPTEVKPSGWSTVNKLSKLLACGSINESPFLQNQPWNNIITLVHLPFFFIPLVREHYFKQKVCCCRLEWPDKSHDISSVSWTEQVTTLSCYILKVKFHKHTKAANKSVQTQVWTQ